MTDTVDTDPQLHSLLWENILGAVDESASEAKRLFDAILPKVETSLKALFSAYFGRNPKVESLAFSLTNAEYNDSDYGGYTFTEVRPKFTWDSLTAEEQQFVGDNGNDYDGFYVSEPFRYVRMGPESTTSADIRNALNDARTLDKALAKVRQFAESLWTDGGVRVTRSTISTFGSSEDLEDEGYFK